MGVLTELWLISALLTALTLFGVATAILLYEFRRVEASSNRSTLVYESGLLVTAHRPASRKHIWIRRGQITRIWSANKVHDRSYVAGVDLADKSRHTPTISWSWQTRAGYARALDDGISWEERVDDEIHRLLLRSFSTRTAESLQVLEEKLAVLDEIILRLKLSHPDIIIDRFSYESKLSGKSTDTITVTTDGYQAQERKRLQMQALEERAATPQASILS